MLNQYLKPYIKEKPKPIYEMAAKTVKLHITHLEDLMLEGPEGFNKVINFLDKLIKKDLSTVTVKFDGKPAVIFGIDPRSGKFIIGTKKAVANPAHSIEEINELYGEQAFLKNLFVDLFPILKSMVKKGLFMGDLMFYPGIKKKVEDEIRFTPNTITYAIDKTSDIGKEIIGAKYGLVVHTMFGSGMSKSAAGSKEIDSNISKNPKIWIASADLKQKEKQTLVDSDVVDKFEELKTLKSTLVKNTTAYEIVKTYSKHIETFINRSVKEGLVIGDEKQFGKDVYKFLQEKYKSPKFKERIRGEFSEKSFQEWGVAFIKAYKLVKEIKNYFIKFIDDVNVIKTLIAAGGEEQIVVGGEGFVMFDTDDGVIKLVDRQTFSRINAINNNN